MPRLVHQTPKYRKHSGGQAFVEINGHRVYLGPYGSKASQVEYDAIFTMWLANGRQLPPDNCTIGELLVDYLTFAKAYYGESSRTEYNNMLVALRPLRELFEALPVAEFGPAQFKAVRQRMIDKGWCRRSVKPARSDCLAMMLRDRCDRYRKEPRFFCDRNASRQRPLVIGRYERRTGKSKHGSQAEERAAFAKR